MSQRGSYNDRDDVQQGITDDEIEASDKVRRTEWRVLGTGVNDLFVREWLPAAGKPKAVICLAHGHGEHGERYAHVAKELAADGYAIIAYDHYGHGRSQGKRGHMLSMEAAIADLTLMLEQCAKRHVEIPIFLYGHSMGGNIALNCAIRTKPDLAGLVLTSPWLRLAFKPPAVKEWLGRRLATFWPALPMSTGLKEEDLFRQNGTEASRSRSMKGDPLSHTTITPRAFTEIQDAGEWAIKHGNELHVPLLLLHGTADRVTSYAASKELADGMREGCDWNSWQDGLHELHNDLQGGEAIACIKAWMNDKL
ncbi:alpha/beta hydrolase [Paenibacillus sp. PAMC21692]|uniref:alpha/beta hydrolase n=1 Tax=Paenibacillus sp. PAMC21692 TaxID=2762320 RepID=UPI00164D98CD|nr:alpha/beta hydrolase [Paenibacillus sp. PAMC21692]QNK56252.1 lysophospholipase [Paenibacillus sp. PAMC21692]